MESNICSRQKEATEKTSRWFVFFPPSRRGSLAVLKKRRLLPLSPPLSPTEVGLSLSFPVTNLHYIMNHPSSCLHVFVWEMQHTYEKVLTPPCYIL